eukprot:scpid66661/ scgid1988/ Probable RNA-directed DNA polymerase from transposon X-element; Reverse transcriptase
MSLLRTSAQRGVPDLECDGNTISSDLDKATTFNNFFVEQSRQSLHGCTGPPPPIHTPRVTDRTLQDVTATEVEVLELLRHIDTNKSAGPDGIPSILLKLTADRIAPSLTIIFNHSFTHGQVPRDWRDAMVSPIFKKGSRACPTNYRPISLLPVVSKLQERIAHKALYRHIQPHLPPEQSGFRKNDSTEYQISRLLHELAADLEVKKSVHVCFFDLSKAFDHVWHRGLLHKLEHHGVRGAALRWFESYLLGRRQRVRIGSTASDWLDIPAAVPQGSVLGPLLFLVYTMDLPAACNSEATRSSLFADDTALIASDHSAAAAERALQSSLTKAATWLDTWHLTVNETKTVVMTLCGAFLLT